MNPTQEIREFVISNFLFGDGASLQNSQSFLDTGIVDSTGMLELIMFVESTYDIKIEPEEMLPENLDSIDRVVQFVSNKKAKVAA